MRKRLMCHNLLPAMQLLLSVLFVVMCVDMVVVLGSQQEGNALKMFIASADPEGKVVKQWGGNDPCSVNATWLGVECTGTSTSTRSVTSLVLDKMNLTGFIPERTLSQLANLKKLSLSNNVLTGQIPADLRTCAQLTHLYMRDNALSGPIPSPLTHRLKRIDLSNNKLSGEIPSSLADIEGLLSLSLDVNRLDSVVPPLGQQSLGHLNVSYNNLSGEIPLAVASRGFPASAFIGNALLCGSPLPNCTVDLSAEASIGPPLQKAAQEKPTTGKIVAIILASVVFVFIALCVALCYYTRRCVGIRLQKKATMKVVPSIEEEGFQSISMASAPGDEDKPRLVFFEEANTFRLQSLLQASAELLGNGSLGCTYRAVLEDGRVMCVKGLKELTNMARRKFEQQMQLVGRLRHPNVVPLWAYYYAKEEKLLVYEYQANGNLHHLLLAGKQSQEEDGSQVTRLKQLSWNARIRIAKDIAKGLAYLHHECECRDIPHGNIKASNIVIGKDYEARIADFGLAALCEGLSLKGQLPHVQAPELHVPGQAKLSRKADVYSFGVLLLELLTGKVTQGGENDASFNRVEDCAFDLPQWVTSVVKEEWSAEVFDKTLSASTACSEESLIRMLQIAMACTSKSPRQRPDMTQVHKMIADIYADAHIASGVFASVDEGASFEFASSSDDNTMISTRIQS